MMNKDYDYLFKVLLIGNSGVGKSSLLLRFADEYFNDTQMPTIGVDFKIRTIEVDSKDVRLQIWDTAGQERFKTITSAYYKGSQGIIVAYDITDRSSFANVIEWMNQIEKNADCLIAKMLIGNKKDLDSQREVSYEEGKELADHYNIKFMETSAKESMNVEESFIAMAKDIKDQISLITREHNGKKLTMKTNKIKDNKSSRCCN